MADIFGLYRNVSNLKKKRNVPFLLYLYIIKYLLKNVIMLKLILLLKVF